MSALDAFRDKLQNVKSTKNGFRASCPVPGHGQGRGDENPSLDFGTNADGKVWFACRVGCSDEEVLEAIGLRFADLYERNGHRNNGSGKPTASWEIKDESGEVQAVHVRVERENGDKDCLWKLPGKKVWGLKGRKLDTLPLYRSELVKDWPEDAIVVLVEGEKAADALSAVYPFVVATVSSASTTPKHEALGVLDSRSVLLWPDNDDPGRKHMRCVAEGLEGIAASILVYEWSAAPEKGDAADHPAVLSGDLKTLLAEWTKAPKREGGAEPSFNRTDLGNAERLVHFHGENIRYIYAWGKWLVYDGKRWRVDDTGEVERLAKETVSSMFHEADPGHGAPIDKELVKHALSSQSATRIGNMIALARSEPGIPVRPDELDSDPWLLNCSNGTLDLRTGELREHRRGDLITKLVPFDYDPNAGAPIFDSFMQRILPSEALRRFLQRAFGYAATGVTREEMLLVAHGVGDNGKTTLANAIMEALGDYSMQAAPDLLMVKRGAHPTELADLFGARLVASVESEEGRRLNESLVKQLTGRDRIKARFMRQDFWEFGPTHTIFFATNHKPEIRGTDHAIWRRIKLIPFEVKIPEHEKDRELPEKLRAELPGILTWIVRGCLDWQRDSLGEPDEVKDATATYRSEQDILGEFIDSCCVKGQNRWVRFSELYDAYKEWSGKTAEGERRFGNLLKERGFEPDRGTGNVAIRRGIALLVMDGGDG